MPKKKVLVATNLLGDSLYLLGPLKKYIETYPDDISSIVVMRGLAGELFRKTPAISDKVPIFFSLDEAHQHDSDIEELHLSAGQAATLAFINSRKAGRQLHISEGYAMMLGVDIEGKVEPPPDWQSYIGKNLPKTHALLCPFSKSCSRHTGGRPNKTLDDNKWENVIRFLRRHNYAPVKVMGGPGERLKNCSLSENDFVSPDNLADTEFVMRSAHVIISIDNGLAHLASSMFIPTLILWPRVTSVEFIAPSYSPKTGILQIGDPNRIRPCQILHGVRRMLAYLENGTMKHTS